MKKCLLLLLSFWLLGSIVGCGGQNLLPQKETQTPMEEITERSDEVTEPLSPSDDRETSDTPTEPEVSPDPKTEIVTALLDAMTLEEKVGQLIWARCPVSEQQEAIEQYHLGGYLLFGRDFSDSEGEWLTREQFTETIAGYQAVSQIPLLIGSDEEGGTVTRASRNPNLYPSPFRSPQTLWSTGGMEAIVEDTAEKSTSLLALGINVNLAPVADVSTDPADFIYDRTLGQDAATTADYIRAVVEEMHTAGIGTVLKHFPGYGNNMDTHTGIAVDERPYDTFTDADFLPFLAGIEAGADSILVSHTIVTSMDANFPASLSSEVHRILREELGFDGVILTDDLAMDAVKAYAENGSAAVLAMLAGNDMIITTSFAEDITAILEAVQDGTIPVEQIDRAVQRVLAWKYDLGLLEKEE